MTNKEKYSKKRKNGICVEKGCNKKTTGKARCSEHLMDRVLYERQERKKKKKKGLCISCKNKARKGKLLCIECNKKRCDREIKYRLKKKKNKQCYRCPAGVPTYLNTTLCKKHLIEHTEQWLIYAKKNRHKLLLKAKKDQDKNREENKCRCGTKLNKEVDKGYKCCINCRLQLHKPQRWRYLNAISNQSSAAGF
jgi:hypothetical protein